MGCVDPRAIVRLEGLGQLKNPMTSLGIEPVTFWLLALSVRVQGITSQKAVIFISVT
jgi:hypothetical protein